MNIKYIFLISVYIISNFYCYCEEINKYQFRKIKIISIGSEPGHIGYDKSLIPAGVTPGPSTFKFNKDGNIYIPDRVNERINIYNNQFEYSYTIIEKNKKQVHETYHFKIDKNNNIIAKITGEGIRKINNSGNLVFKVNNLPRAVTSVNNFFIHNDKILFYDDKKNIKSISVEGIIETSQETQTYLNGLDLQKENSGYRSGIGPETELTEVQQGVIQTFKSEKKGIIIGDKLYQASFYKNREYFEKLQQKELKIVEGQQSLTEETQKNLLSRGITPESDKVMLDIDKYDLYFIDYDKNHNSYWKAKQKKAVKAVKKHLIVIFSRYGELLDAFQFGETFRNHPNTELFDTTWAIPAIAPNGDVWFMKGSEKGHTFWKVERKW